MTPTKKQNDVEFNNGFITALGLFYGHRGQFQESSRILKSDLSIYAAADHLFELEYPKNLDKKLKRKIRKFVKDVFAVRLDRISNEEATKLFDKCYQLLMEIDKQIFGLKVTVNYP